MKHMSEGMKLCGILDNEGYNKFCLPKNVDCPINRIIESDKPQKIVIIMNMQLLIIYQYIILMKQVKTEEL